MNSYKSGYIKIEPKKILSYIGNDETIHFFYEENGQNYFFKQEWFGAVVEGELLAGKIGQKLGLNVVQVKPAYVVFEDKKFYGVASKNYLPKGCFKFDFNYYSFYDNSFEVDNCTYNMILRIIKNHIQMENDYDNTKLVLDKNIYKNLQEMIFFDFLTMQTDRATRNFDFYMQKENGNWVVKLAPIFDNSSIFGFIELMCECDSGVKIHNTKTLFNNITANTTFLTAFSKDSNYNKLFNDIKKLVYRNPYFERLCLRAKQIDILECINEIENQYKGFKFPKEFVDFAKYGWDKTLASLNSLTLNTEFEQDKKFDSEIGAKKIHNKNGNEFSF